MSLLSVAFNLWSVDEIFLATFRLVLQINEQTRKPQAAPMTGDRNQRWTFAGDGTVMNDTGLVLDIQGLQQESEVGATAKHGCENQLFRQIFITRKR